jgi:hypothetical protein
MPYDIRLVKLINGETVVGKWDEESKRLKELAILQTVPTQQGVQMVLMPFGYPFETEIGAALGGCPCLATAIGETDRAARLIDGQIAAANIAKGEAARQAGAAGGQQNREPDVPAVDGDGRGEVDPRIACGQRDIGALDEEGYLTITGRKKELIVTAGGKNVAPAALEDPIRANPIIGQVVVVGDRKPSPRCSRT